MINTIYELLSMVRKRTELQPKSARPPMHLLRWAASVLKALRNTTGMEPGTSARQVTLVMAFIHQRHPPSVAVDCYCQTLVYLLCAPEEVQKKIYADLEQLSLHVEKEETPECRWMDEARAWTDLPDAPPLPPSSELLGGEFQA